MPILHLRFLALALVLALAIGVRATGFAPVVPAGLQINVTSTSIEDFDLCYNFTYGTVGPSQAWIDAACVGPYLFMGCKILPYYELSEGAGANRTSFFAGSVIDNDVRFYYNTTSLSMGFRNSSLGEPAQCLAAVDVTDMCWSLNPNTSAVQLTGRCGGQFVLGAFQRQIYGTPCANKTENDTCVAPGHGLCATAGRCDATGHCVDYNVTQCSVDPLGCQTSIGCDPTDGLCKTADKSDGTPCFDGDICTYSDFCSSGVCQPGPLPYLCPLPDPCYNMGVCNSTSQACDYAPLTNGTSCATGDLCLINGFCNGAGGCIEEPVVCTCGACVENCTCNNGTCAGDTAPDGTWCNQGFETQCELNGTCASGACIATEFVDCTTPVGCYGAGTCDNQTGVCVNRTALPFDTPCNGPSSCSTYSCNQFSICTVKTTQTCPPLNECYMQGTANGTGPTCVCSNNYFDGRSCDTGDPCELGVCATGTCTVDAPVTCPGDECNFPLGSCNIVTGCANPKPDGTACTAPNGCASQCSAGVCPNPTTCAASELRAFWLFMFIFW